MPFTPFVARTGRRFHVAERCVGHAAPQFHAIFFGAIRIGAVPIPVNTMMTAKDDEYYLNDPRARVLVISEELRPMIHQIEGDLPYLRDLIVISEKDGTRLPFKQKYKCAPSVVKTALTTKDDPGFWLSSSGFAGSPKSATGKTQRYKLRA